MNRSTSILAVRFVSVALIASSTVMAGCMASEEPDTTIDSAEEALIDESGARVIPTQDEVHLERKGEGETLSLVPNAAWRELAPGVWESAAQEGANRIVLGAEGHQWAIEQAEKGLSDLHKRSALQADSDSALIEAIAQQETQLENLKETAQNLKAVQAGTPQALSCNISFYTGPSWAVAGYDGAAALAQVSCSGGCQTFTVSAQACTNFGCSPVYASSRFVCATPWTYGVAKSGTYGASCSSAASVSPPGITSSWSGFCG